MSGFWLLWATIPAWDMCLNGGVGTPHGRHPNLQGPRPFSCCLLPLEQSCSEDWLTYSCSILVRGRTVSRSSTKKTGLNMAYTGRMTPDMMKRYVFVMAGWVGF